MVYLRTAPSKGLPQHIGDTPYPALFEEAQGAIVDSIEVTGREETQLPTLQSFLHSRPSPVRITGIARPYRLKAVSTSTA
jgi:hypothetical protein